MTESETQVEKEPRELIFEIIKENPGITYGELLDKVNERVGEGGKITAQGLNAHLRVLMKENRIVDRRDEKGNKKYCLLYTSPSPRDS